ncbi:helix-turn-helix domain-containing protein [Salibacterium sp. K-3]
MEIEIAFGMILREYRNRSGYSQEQLALLCGLDRTYIGLLERGKRKPTITTIFSLSYSLKVKPNIFIKDVEKKLY